MERGAEAMVFKIIFFVLAVLIGVWFAGSGIDSLDSWIRGLGFGAVALAFAWVLDYLLTSFSRNSIKGLAAGLGVSSIAFLAFYVLFYGYFSGFFGVEPEEPTGLIKFFVPAVFLVLFYLGITLGLMKGGDLERRGFGGGFQGMGIYGQVCPKILDTSVIIDGRIADVAEAGFVDGEMIIPKFIIQELQYIADSTDPIKRVRGRRGLDVLKKMQRDIEGIAVKITDDDYLNIKEADLKLVELAKDLKGIIITNDFNLNKVAALQHIKVLNLNELANALKPIVLPGETMRIQVVKQGKEENQGIGYLEDGTMVVVDDARNLVGKNTDVSVTSVLQTPTGRMIFSKIKGERKRYN